MSLVEPERKWNNKMCVTHTQPKLSVKKPDHQAKTLRTSEFVPKNAVISSNKPGPHTIQSRNFNMVHHTHHLAFEKKAAMMWRGKEKTTREV